MDRAFKTANRTADLVLSGHVHNYQRFMRKVGRKLVPYIVAGAGGYADSERAMQIDPVRSVPSGNGTRPICAKPCLT